MNKLSPFVLCFAVILAPLLSAAADLPAGLKSAALQARSRGDGKTLFTRLETGTTGLDMLNKMDVSHPMSYLYHSGMTTGGVAVADFDGDGKPDIFFAGTTSKNRLYRQMGALGEMKFQDITASAGPIDGGENWTAGAAAADVNGDGRPDLYVCNYDKPNQLFLNQGKGPKGEAVVFQEVAAPTGLDAVDCSHSAYFPDYDGDGKLDMYLLTNRLEDPADKHADGTLTLKPGAERCYALWRLDFGRWGIEATGTPDRLYHNDGNGPDGCRNSPM